MQIRIKQYSFSLPDIYAPGHVLTESEAIALNGLRAENIRNNFVKKWPKLTAETESRLLTADELAGLQGELSAQASRYRFAERNGGRRQQGGLAIMIKAVAEEFAWEIHQREVVQTQAGWETLLEKFLLDPAVQAEARKRWEEKERVTSAGLEDLL